MFWNSIQEEELILLSDEIRVMASLLRETIQLVAIVIVINVVIGRFSGEGLTWLAK